MTYADNIDIMASMTNNDNTKGNTMGIDYEHGMTENASMEDQHNTNWQHNADEVAHITGSRHIRLVDDPEDPEHDEIGDADTEYDIEDPFENHVGDGPSGFDLWHDTKWCC